MTLKGKRINIATVIMCISTVVILVYIAGYFLGKTLYYVLH
ncbi:hypothetical protein JoomaDRAFT_2894 [Galbibacter orientalis DSM 19592]|uniref:Uncharacterized protein n=1 Tax=Galbibacter orientalis DSM 19592 TaxID=926559 RepID=I3C8B2_9FLAO|nr:hypothetical protein JoomaDRAFT_2894 [Galbibacter orientalis DSM 19592]